MGKKYLRIAAVCCVLAYAAALGSAFVRIWLASDALEETAMREFSELVDRANAAAALGFMDTPFRETIRDTVYRSKGLAAAIVTGPAGPEYAVERRAGYLDALEGVPRFSSRFELAPTPLVAPLRIDNVRNATIQVARLQAMPDSIYAALRDALLFTLIPLLASLFLLFFTISKPSPEASPQASPETASGTAREPRSAPRNATQNATQNATLAAGPSVIDDAFDIPEIAADAPPEGNGESGTPAGLFDPETGLGWEQYLDERLEAELRRSASFEQDIVLLLFSIDTAGGLADDKADGNGLRNFAEAIVSFFTFRDLAFRRGSGTAVILPNVDLDHGIRMADEFLKKFRKNNAAMKSATIRAGLSARSGRLVDARRVITEAEGALKRAAEDPTSPVIAFKPDPERYRSFISSTKTSG